MKLSANFSLRELTYSRTALRNGIDQTPNDEQLQNLSALCNRVLQPLRTALNRPVRVNSGFRSDELNKKIGGSSKSQHCYGEAADIEMDSLSTLELAQYIKDNYIFDQLILEFHNPKDKQSGWVHISLKRDGANRNEVLSAVKEDGATVYKYGLVTS